MFGGQGSDFWRRVALERPIFRFAKMISDDFARQVQHFVLPGVTLAWQAQHFRKVEWENRRPHSHETVSSPLTLPYLKEVAQNFFVLDGGKRKNNIVVNPTDT
jgi:hypothetical protein